MRSAHHQAADLVAETVEFMTLLQADALDYENLNRPPPGHERKLILARDVLERASSLLNLAIKAIDQAEMTNNDKEHAAAKISPRHGDALVLKVCPEHFA